MKTLLTGATGFIGKEVCKLITDKVCVVRPRKSHDFESFIEVPTIDGETDWTGAFEGISSVIHLAGLAHKQSFSTDDFTSINVEGTLNLAQSAANAGVKRFVFVSSIAVNGPMTGKSPLNSSSSPKPMNSAARSKLDAERGLMDLSKESGLEVVIVRAPLVYGAGAPANFGALCRLIQKTPALPFGLSNNRRTYISVQNIADLLVTCTSHPDAAGEIFLASEGPAISTKEFTDAIAHGLGKKVIQVPIPVVFFRFLGALTGRQAKIELLFGNLEFDSSDIKKVLGWTPPYQMSEAMALLKEDK